MKTALLTFSYGNENYYKFGLNLLNKFKNRNFDIFVLTDNEHLFKDFNVLHYNYEKFSYHHKIMIMENLYDMGYEKILYIDSDLIIFDDNFFNDIKNINFETGVSFTRNGHPENLSLFLHYEKLDYYKNKLSTYDLGDYENIPSIWEDILFFNFTNFNANEFFKYFRILMDIKHESDTHIGWYLYGDQEGYAISMACKLSNFKCEINEEFKDTLKYLRATNLTYYGIKPIMAEVDFIIPYRYDSEKRKENLIKCLDYYQSKFKDSNFIISEQGVNQTIKIDNIDYVYVYQNAPHNQSKCINDGVKLSTKKIICVIDSDIILLPHENIYLAVKEIFKGELDYSLPYFECYDLPDFKVRKPWGRQCVGGIFVIDREKFIECGMNDERFVGWGREDDERHKRLISKNLRFNRFNGSIIHMDHPKQENELETGSSNLDLLKKITNDHSSFNKI